MVGRKTLALCLGAYGIGCVSYDLCLGPEFDISDELVWERLLKEIQSGRYAFLFSSFPCKSAAIPRHNPDRGPGPGPLRSVDKPWGLPNLKPTDKELVRIGNLCATRSAAASRALLDSGGVGFAFEQPSPVDGLPSLLHLPPLDMQDVGAQDVHFHQCPFGAPSIKPTCIRYCGGSFSLLSSFKCNHKMQRWKDSNSKYYWAPHQKLAGRKLDDGRWATEVSQEYPDDLNKELASHIAAALWGHSGDPAKRENTKRPIP